MTKKQLENYITEIRPKADAYDRVCEMLGIKNDILGYIQKLKQVSVEPQVSFGEFDLTDKVERARIFMMDVAWADDKTMTAKDAREIITRVYGKGILEEVLSRFSH